MRIVTGTICGASPKLPRMPVERSCDTEPSTGPVVAVSDFMRAVPDQISRWVPSDYTSLGADGFGFAPGGEAYAKIPQIGIVVVEDDVEIGANTTIDRAVLGETRLGHGCKIDNLVMIAHNVTIGPNTVIAAQAGISGSTHVGPHATIAGQAGIAGHLHIGENSILGAQAGVTRDVEPKTFVSGYPARPHSESMRQLAALARLPELLKKINTLEARLKTLEAK